jgi:hypothetical protein
MVDLVLEVEALILEGGVPATAKLAATNHYGKEKLLQHHVAVIAAWCAALGLAALYEFQQRDVQSRRKFDGADSRQVRRTHHSITASISCGACSRRSATTELGAEILLAFATRERPLAGVAMASASNLAPRI